MYHKYRDSLFNIRYSYRGQKYRDVPVHRCIVAGLRTCRRTHARTHARVRTHTHTHTHTHWCSGVVLCRWMWNLRQNVKIYKHVIHYCYKSTNEKWAVCPYWFNRLRHLANQDVKCVWIFIKFLTCFGTFLSITIGIWQWRFNGQWNSGRWTVITGVNFILVI